MERVAFIINPFSAKKEYKPFVNDLEKRVVLSSIDELWMRHIDSMSKLRDEVAFE